MFDSVHSQVLGRHASNPSTNPCFRAAAAAAAAACRRPDNKPTGNTRKLAPEITAEALEGDALATQVRGGAL